MNKKFLSAILFGALMVTSTGTFVSCKDYDDDIDAINKELTDIKSQIAALQTKVENGNYVTNITKATNGINVTFSNGTTSFVETGAVVETEECYASAATIVDGEWVIAKADGTVVPTGIPASGVLVTGSEATGYVLSVVNAEGTVTEVKLPTAASTLQSLEVLQARFNAIDGPNSEFGFSWGYKDAKMDWAGPLGNIAKEQLLVGVITNAELAVRPVAYDLSAQELTFVDNQGNVAPVQVVATPSSDAWIVDGSRAASKTGKWNLSIKMTSDVTIKNVASIFTAKVNDTPYNKKYALAINGNIASEYEFVIKAATEKQSGFGFMADRLYIGNEKYSSTKNYAVDKSYVVSYKGERNLADAYLTLSEAEKVKAELLGVTIDGMTINAPKSSANGAVTFTLKMLAVNGTVNTESFTMKFGTSTVDSEATLAATTHTVTGIVSKQYVDINVSEIFKNLTSAEIDVLDGDLSLVVAPEQGENVFLSGVSAKYFPIKDGKINVGEGEANAITLNDKDVTAKTIAFIRVKTTAEFVNPKAKVGTYNLILTLKNVNGNELKKVTIPVTFALPAFTDLYVKSESGNWNGETFSAKLLNGGKIDLATAFIAAEGYATSSLKFKTAEIKDVLAEKTTTGTTLEYALVKDNALKATSLATTASYQFYTAAYENLVVKSNFTLDIHSQFEAPKLVYYVNGVAKDVATVGEGNKIVTLYSNDNGKQGLAIQYGKGEKAFEYGVVVDGVTIQAAAATADNTVKAVASIKNVPTSSVTMNATTTTARGNVVVSESKGTLVVKFTDVNNVVSTATIAFE